MNFLEANRPEPPFAAPPEEMVEGFLDYLRATMLWKLDGLSDDDLRRPFPPSTMTLLGMLKHLAYVERWWFRIAFAGEELPMPWTDTDPRCRLAGRAGRERRGDHRPLQQRSRSLPRDRRGRVLGRSGEAARHGPDARLGPHPHGRRDGPPLRPHRHLSRADRRQDRGVRPGRKAAIRLLPTC